MISLTNINVTFQDKKHTVHAVKNVSLTVEQGEIYGIVGYSGAGKSTLVRVINLLQRPTSGSVVVAGNDLLKLTSKELRQARKKIGMIFQHFNLMGARTVYENVDYPLRKSGLSKQQRKEKILSLLELVGLSDKKDTYPSQLSGGQKQRVAIARALANDPEILLCDEATSALDPKTTLAILELLKKVNQELDLTIVLITHEMQVVKEICHKVAVMEDGEVIESGDIATVFSKPKQTLTEDFIQTATHTNRAIETIVHNPDFIQLGKDDTLVQLSYVGSTTKEPLIADVYSKFNVKVNILFGNVEILQQTPFGQLIVVLSGEREDRKQAISFLESQKITIRQLDFIPREKNIEENHLNCEEKEEEVV